MYRAAQEGSKTLSKGSPDAVAKRLLLRLQRPAAGSLQAACYETVSESPLKSTAALRSILESVIFVTCTCRP